MIDHTPPLPNPSSDAYLWYKRGREDEAAARNEGLSTGAIEVIATVTALAKLKGIECNQRNLILVAAKIYCPRILRWRFRRE